MEVHWMSILTARSRALVENLEERRRSIHGAGDDLRERSRERVARGRPVRRRSAAHTARFSQEYATCEIDAQTPDCLLAGDIVALEAQTGVFCAGGRCSIHMPPLWGRSPPPGRCRRKRNGHRDRLLPAKRWFGSPWIAANQTWPWSTTEEPDAINCDLHLLPSPSVKLHIMQASQGVTHLRTSSDCC